MKDEQEDKPKPVKSPRSAKTQERVIKLIYPEDMQHKPVSPASGSRYTEFTCVLVNQVADTLWTKNSDEAYVLTQRQAAIEGIVGVKPQDEIEGMLAAQMVAAHNAAMECYRRAMHSEQSFQGRSENLTQANKLSRSYATMMEALSRYRGKGQQKMTVEHVHVHAGGQAIVGPVSNLQGGGGEQNSEEPAHAKAITHAPMPEMPRKDEEREPVPVTRDA